MLKRVFVTSLVTVAVLLSTVSAELVQGAEQAQLPPKGEALGSGLSGSGQLISGELKKPTKVATRPPLVLKVGPNEQYRVPSEAAETAQEGDTILIDANGDYTDDTLVWKQSDLKIMGVNGRPKIKAVSPVKNGKAIWVIQGDNVKIDNIEMSGASVRDRNGAAIRAEGTNLTINQCYFHHNENGILSGTNPESVISITNSEFSHNGGGRGRTHNVYIGAISKLRFIGNFSHHANVGHTFKSRAHTNEILYNRFMDGVDGNASYLIDIPDGGYAVVMGNIIQQGPKAENWALLAYGLESLSPKYNNNIYISFNTFVNDRHSGVFMQTHQDAKGMATNNIFSGKGEILKGNISLQNNIKTAKHKYFSDPTIFDYHLKDDREVLDRATVTKTEDGVTLTPEYQIGVNGLEKRYQHGTALDPGAYEYWVF